MEFGICTFGETTPDPATGVAITAGERLRNLIEEVELADRMGLDVYAVGEHHRSDYAVSAPAVVLAAAAARTKRIKLSSAVTVLSSDDPVRVYQQFATVDLISDGRAEIMAGRGSFIESFPLFGFDLQDYDDLFSEKLALLLGINRSEKVRWPGGHRPAIDGLGVYPRAEREIPVWIAVGGTPQSVARAGAQGLPLMIAIIGGQPERFAPLVDLYREAGRRSGQPAETLAVGINVHGFLADRAEDAVETFWGPYAQVMGKIGRERGWSGVTRAQYEASLDLRGNLMVGSPDQAIEKILFHHRTFGHDRFLLQMSVGTVPHDKMLRSIELFGTVVVPAVRAAIGSG